MGATTYYKCDRCNAEVGTGEEGRKLLSGVYFYCGTAPSWTIIPTQVNRQWCRKCLEELGVKFQGTPESRPDSMPSGPGRSAEALDRLIREIVREEVESQ
jgi:hypothetical protein